MKPTPLNGQNSHPMSAATRRILEDSATRPVPVQSLNPGVMDRIRREGCVTELRPSPYASHKGRLIEFLCGPARPSTPDSEGDA